ncbi:hypothetical protein EDD27_7667 [Nonomuraea polychroma]|uniref:Uncharacterized protein n=1 Tax=Nonomuraea polychroma TaxID=46176 RepID=A0A438MHI2_9ACTN|nr:hypothetical protein EDD27_7667 [Nonomuraea polychroma]
MTTAIRPADRGAGTFDSSVCKLVTWVRHARYYSPLSVWTELRRAAMRQTTHFVQPPPTTSHIVTPAHHLEPPLLDRHNQPPNPQNAPHSREAVQHHVPGTPTSKPRHQPLSEPQHAFLLLLPAHLPQPGVHPLPRTPAPRPHRSRRIGLLNTRPRTMFRSDLRLPTPRPLRHHPHRRRHSSFIRPSGTSRRRHKPRPERHPSPRTATTRHASGRDTILKPLHLAHQQSPGKDRRRQQRPEQHDGPPPHLPVPPTGHRQTLSAVVDSESDHLSCLYRSSEHP